MSEKHTPSFTRVAYTHFVPCLFVGFVVLYLGHALQPGRSIAILGSGHITLYSTVIAVLNGLVTAAITVGYHMVRRRGSRSKRRPTSVPQASCRNAAGAAFCTGSLGVMLGLHNGGLLILTTIVLIILALHLRAFSRQMPTMLQPGNVATWKEVSELMRIYMTMLAGFTLVNATLEGMHLLAGGSPPFGFTAHGGEIFLNALYFTVVSMTSLGFGDIVPRTWDAKLLLIFQSLVSYFMFALVIGIVTRGVTRTSVTQNDGDPHAS